MTLPSVHAPDRDVDGSPATHNHPLGRRFPPAQGHHRFRGWYTGVARPHHPINAVAPERLGAAQQLMLLNDAVRDDLAGV